MYIESNEHIETRDPFRSLSLAPIGFLAFDGHYYQHAHILSILSIPQNPVGLREFVNEMEITQATVSDGKRM